MKKEKEEDKLPKKIHEVYKLTKEEKIHEYIKEINDGESLESDNLPEGKEENHK